MRSYEKLKICMNDIDDLEDTVTALEENVLLMDSLVSQLEKRAAENS